MSLRPPRRIFRSNTTRRGGRWPAAIGFGLAIGTAVSLVLMFATPAELMGRVPPVSGTITGAAGKIAVVDGETLILDEHVVRLDGVVAPPRGQACRDQQGAAFDCGGSAAAALADLLRGHDVVCRMGGRDREGFPRGVCEAAGVELNRAMVAGGWARARDGMPALAGEEATARAASRGLWGRGGL